MSEAQAQKEMPRYKCHKEVHVAAYRILVAHSMMVLDRSLDLKQSARMRCFSSLASYASD